jgi:hypothetical protein
MKLFILAFRYHNNRRTASVVGGVDDAANKASASKWNQLLGLTETLRSTCR